MERSHIISQEFSLSQNTRNFFGCEPQGFLIIGGGGLIISQWPQSLYQVASFTVFIDLCLCVFIDLCLCVPCFLFGQHGLIIAITLKKWAQFFKVA